MRGQQQLRLAACGLGLRKLLRILDCQVSAQHGQLTLGAGTRQEIGPKVKVELSRNKRGVWARRMRIEVISALKKTDALKETDRWTFIDPVPRPLQAPVVYGDVVRRVGVESPDRLTVVVDSRTILRRKVISHTNQDCLRAET